ncbi:MAG: DUF6867 family protein [Alphaproteobacteria bacterium]
MNLPLLGVAPSVFIGVTLLLMGFTAFMTGQGCANTWRPMSQLLPYAALLGCLDRFLGFALFGGQLLLLSGYLIDTAVLLAIAALGYRLTLVRRMTEQYPWLYERAGPLRWRSRGH